MARDIVLLAIPLLVLMARVFCDSNERVDAEVRLLTDSLRSRLQTISNYNLSGAGTSVRQRRDLVRLYRQKAAERAESSDSAAEDNGGDDDDDDSVPHRTCYIIPVELELYGGYARVSADTDVLYQQSSFTGIHSAHLSLTHRLPANAPPPSGAEPDSNTEALLFYELLPSNASRLVTSQVITLSADAKRLEADVKDIVERWQQEKYASSRRTIEIRAVGSRPLNHTLSRSADSVPTLDVCTYIARRRRPAANRVRRAAKKRHKCRGDCCRRAVKVKYADLGLQIDGVYGANDTFTAYVCAGKCRRDSRLFTNYSNIKNALYKLTKDKLYRNRCVPKSYKKNFELFHFNQHGILALGVFDDVIVKDCACT